MALFMPNSAYFHCMALEMAGTRSEITLGKIFKLGGSISEPMVVAFGRER